MLLPDVKTYFESLDTGAIDQTRRNALDALHATVRAGLVGGEPVRLTFICTHNSRRSHLAQAWAQAAAYHYGLPGVLCFSGGTEATACNPRTVAALERAGWATQLTTGGDNPVYRLGYARGAPPGGAPPGGTPPGGAPPGGAPPVTAYSKVYDEPPNPAHDFVAVLTCDRADQDCPHVPGAVRRLAITYRDPKEADGTLHEAQTYDERCRQIATEMKYVFSGLRS